MNIGIDIRALSSSRLSGVGRYVYNSIKYILELDRKNNYYLISTGLKDVPPEWLNFKYDNIHHIHWHFSNKIINLLTVFGLGPDLTKKIPVKLDLFWLANINFFKFPKDVPVILTIHDLSFLHSRQFYSLKRRLWHKLVNVRKLARKANLIIAVSENTKRDIMRFFTVDDDKITVIYPGVSTKNITLEEANNLLAPYKLKDKYFLYVGTLEPRKNINAIIKAFAHYHSDYPDTELVIVGAKGWIYQGILRSIAKRSYIHYLNYVDGPSKNALYSQAQALIWPSFYEGYGFPPLEASYYNIPVITSYKTSLPEIMKDKALYVDPYNVSDIYKLLVNLTEHKDLYDFSVNNNHNFVLPRHEKQAQRIIRQFYKFKNDQ
ncbi:glycosyltransferase family 1 protein [Candidatus Parcubacteria bacterium]|nr:MAG: glycosyltransferase family 1 protein [Candidatus Parcubacteria bacterium]